MTSSANYIAFLSESFWLHDQIDYYIRFENLQSDFSDLCKLIGMENQVLPGLKTKNRKDKNYKEYYNDYSKQIISNVFSKSIKRFNYEF